MRQCPNCAGSLEIDPTGRKYTCRFCGAEFDVEKKDKAAPVNNSAAEYNPWEDYIQSEQEQQPMASKDPFAYIKGLCDVFLAKHPKEGFDKGNPDLLRLLESNGVETYLAYDSSTFGKGKNGFAITRDGFRCKSFMGALYKVGFAESKGKKILLKSDGIWLVNTKALFSVAPQLAYFPGLRKAAKTDLNDLYQRLIQ